MRDERIFALKDCSFYPGSETLDMVFFLPPEEKPRHLWLMTEAENPILRIDDLQLRVQKVITGPPRWLDMGVTTEISSPRGFGQLRIRGMTPKEATNSFLVVTSQTDLEISGEIKGVEEELWGISREDAGKTTISPSRLIVGEPACFTVRYSAEAKALPPKSRIRFYLPGGFAQPQTKNLNKNGALWCEGDDSIQIESIIGSEESHEANDIICYLPQGLPSAGNFSLKYRTSTTYIFPCCFHKTDRKYWYSKLPVLSAAVAVDERKVFVSLAEENGHIVEFVPGPAERLHLFLPGRRKRGKEIMLSGVFSDRYSNVPPSGPVATDIRLLLLSNGKRTSLGTPAKHFKDKHRFEVTLPNLKPGIYRAIALDGSSKTIATSNPLEILPADSNEDEICWGEIHGHTEMSDGSGRFPELYRHTRDEGHLDFVAATDHACYFSDNEWSWMQDVTNSCNSPGKFITLIGYEWAGKQGHRNIYTSRNYLKLFRGMYQPTSILQTVWEYFKEDKTVVAGPHKHTSVKGFMEFHQPLVERFFEVYSMWGASDSPDNPLACQSLREGHSASADELLKKGFLLGFTGGGDCHEGHCGFCSEDPKRQGKVPHTFAKLICYRCGMTAGLLKHLDRKSLISALRERRTYATTGARILLSFSLSGIKMGGEGKVKTSIVKAKVYGCAPLKRIELIKDGKTVFYKNEEKMDISIEWKDPEPLKQKHFYYLRVIQADGQMAWSSPIWINKIEKGGRKYEAKHYSFYHRSATR